MFLLFWLFAVVWLSVWSINLNEINNDNNYEYKQEIIKKNNYQLFFDSSKEFHILKRRKWQERREFHQVSRFKNGECEITKILFWSWKIIKLKNVKIEECFINYKIK